MRFNPDCKCCCLLFSDTYGTCLNEIQLITVEAAVEEEPFTLTFDGQTTGNIAINASASTVQTALEALSNIDSGDVSVTGEAGGPWTVEFQGQYENTDVPLMTAAGVHIITITATQESSSELDGYDKVDGDWYVDCVFGAVATDSATGLIAKEILGLATSYFVRGDVYAENEDDIVGLVFGYKDANNYYVAQLKAGSGIFATCGLLQVVKVESGSPTTLFEYELPGVTLAEWHRIEVCVEITGGGYDTILTMHVHADLGSGVERRFKIEDDDPITELISVGFSTETNTGTAKFDNLYVYNRKTDELNCPECRERCQLFYFYGGADADGGTIFNACEFTETGTVAYSNFGQALLIDVASIRANIYNPDDDLTCKVEAAGSVNAYGMKIRIHGANSAAKAGPWGEVEFQSTYLVLRVSDGTDIQSKITATAPTLNMAILMQLCVRENSVSFVTAFGTVDIFTGSLDGPYFFISSSGTGEATINYFEGLRGKDPRTNENCFSCVIGCGNCLDFESPEELIAVVDGVAGDPQISWFSGTDPLIEHSCNVDTDCTHDKMLNKTWYLPAIAGCGYAAVLNCPEADPQTYPYRYVSLGVAIEYGLNLPFGYRIRVTINIIQYCAVTWCITGGVGWYCYPQRLCVVELVKKLTSIDCMNFNGFELTYASDLDPYESAFCIWDHCNQPPYVTDCDCLSDCDVEDYFQNLTVRIYSP